jgi:hypothetical protein
VFRRLLLGAALVLLVPAAARAQLPEPNRVPLREILRRLSEAPANTQPRPDLVQERRWRATASHNERQANRAFNPSGWTSGVPQQPGVWFQIELPEPADLTAIEFESAETAPRRQPGAWGASVSSGAIPGSGATTIVARVAEGAATSERPAASEPASYPPPTVGRLDREPASGAEDAPGAPSLGPISRTPARVAPAGGAGVSRGAPSGPGPAPDAAEAALAAIGFPRIYRVQVSSDGREWSLPVAAGHGSGRRTVISFPRLSTKFLRITSISTEQDLPPWSIRNLRLASGDVRRVRLQPD